VRCISVERVYEKTYIQKLIILNLNREYLWDESELAHYNI